MPMEVVFYCNKQDFYAMDMNEMLLSWGVKSIILAYWKVVAGQQNDILWI